MNQKKNMSLIFPRRLRTEELNGFRLKLLDRCNKLNLPKEYYSPNEIDLLPCQSIFPAWLSCSICFYSSKARKYLVRHLATHNNEQNIPEQKPILLNRSEDISNAQPSGNDIPKIGEWKCTICDEVLLTTILFTYRSISITLLLNSR